MLLCISCNTTSLLIGNNIDIENTEISSSINFNHKIQFIDSYITNIDFKTNDFTNISLNDLKINGSKRLITSDESEKKVILKNNSIVKVRYNDHLHNNFIKSKEFYYNNNALVCIKINNILPNNLNKNILHKRVIYIEDNKAILDSEKESDEISSNELVLLGLELLKEEYLSLQ